MRLRLIRCSLIVLTLRPIPSALARNAGPKVRLQLGGLW